MRPALLTFGILLAASPAVAQNSRQITPYIEAGQVVTTDFDDTLTYTTVAAGIDANVQTRRVQVQASYRYERRIPYDGRLEDVDIHTGLARAAVQVARPLTIEAGALATRTRSDIRGAAPGVLTGNVANIGQLYAVYAGPTFATTAGPLSVSAQYRFGYTKFQGPSIASPLPGQPPLDVFDDSTSHLAVGSVSLPANVYLPVGVTVSGAWARDDAGQLRQRYDGKYGRGDVVWPVLPTLALTAGAGYENIQVSQRDILLDATGQPVRDGRGRFQIDPAGLRRVAYDFNGVYYDGGFIWRPSPRTQLEVHAGERYGSFTAIGQFTYQPSKNVAVRVSGYDGIQTFGRQVQGGLAAAPTAFNTQTNPFGQDFNGCVFGPQGGAAGNCLNGALQSAQTSAYRARGIDAVVSVNRGRWAYGLGFGYANRRYVAPNGGTGVVVAGLQDESVYLQAYLQRQLDAKTTIDANVFANYFRSGIFGAPRVYGVGATTALTRRFGRLGAVAALGIYNSGQDGFGDVTSLQALLGARYSF
ncbi:MAG: hypothetical protein A4S16_01775 [Proteobacteria bacterium SG_bin6]|nr:MAG: hypothetical protein A4S16_01775 [Proteobacteria bacterium SG_bin6]